MFVMDRSACWYVWHHMKKKEMSRPGHSVGNILFLEPICLVVRIDIHRQLKFMYQLTTDIYENEI